jgi:hypothetical protein
MVRGEAASGCSGCKLEDGRGIPAQPGPRLPMIPATRGIAKRLGRDLLGDDDELFQALVQLLG